MPSVCQPLSPLIAFLPALWPSLQFAPHGGPALAGGTGASTYPREVLLLTLHRPVVVRGPSGLVERKILGIGRLAGTPGRYLKRPQGQK